MNATDAVAELGHLAQEEWIPRNGARVVARAWVDPAFRARLLRNGRAAVAELGLSMPKHHRHLVVLENTADGAERHLLHALLVHRLHDHRAAAGLVQGPRVPLARRARVAHRAEGDGPRPFARGRNARVGHHRGYALHGAARAAAAYRRVAGGEARRDRHARCPDRRRATVGASHGRHARPRRQAGLRRRSLHGRRDGVSRGLGSARQFALRVRGAARPLQHGRVPPRHRAHGAAPLSDRELLRAIRHEPRDAAGGERHRDARGARAPGRGPVPACRAECAGSHRRRRHPSDSSPATGSGSRPTTCRDTCACPAISAARPASS